MKKEGATSTTGEDGRRVTVLYHIFTDTVYLDEERPPFIALFVDSFFRLFYSIRLPSS